MKPKLKRKKYGNGSSIWDTASVPSDVLAGVPKTDNVLMDPSQVTTSSQSTVGPLSGIKPEGIGSATPVSTGMSDATGSLLTAAGTTGLKMAGNAVNSSAPRTTAGYMTRQALKDAGTGASLGSTIGGIAGSFIPGVGNVVGGLAGATVGAELGAIEGAARGYFQGRKAKKSRDFQEQQDVANRKDALAMQQQFGDQTIGTQQTNPVYGMKDGGSLYDMAHMKHGSHVKKKRHLGHHESGIVNSKHNGVDKTKASMPEGAFVIPADKRDQAIQDGILENKPISPNQGGVPIMISGGDVSNPEREGVIMPGRVKELLSMGVDLDKYAPNAEHSLYDIAGTRKNVMHGGRLHYVKGNEITRIEDFDKINEDNSDQPTYTGIPSLMAQNPVMPKTPAGWNVNTVVPQIPDYYGPDVTIPYRIGPPANSNETVKQNDSNEKTPMTNQEKLDMVQRGLLGLQGAASLFNMARNLRMDYKPLPRPEMYTYTPYTPNLSAMDALQKEKMDIARATALYNARESGLTQGQISSIHANELQAQNEYNAQRTALSEGAREKNILAENELRKQNLDKMYNYNLADYQNLMQFKGQKAAAVEKNTEQLINTGKEFTNYEREILERDVDKQALDWSSSNNRAVTLGHNSFSPAEYRKNKDAILAAQNKLFSLQQKYGQKYNDHIKEISGMSPIDAAAYMEKTLK